LTSPFNRQVRDATRLHQQWPWVDKELIPILRKGVDDHWTSDWRTNDIRRKLVGIIEAWANERLGWTAYQIAPVMPHLLLCVYSWPSYLRPTLDITKIAAPKCYLAGFHGFEHYLSDPDAIISIELYDAFGMILNQCPIPLGFSPALSRSRRRALFEKLFPADPAHVLNLQGRPSDPERDLEAARLKDEEELTPPEIAGRLGYKLQKDDYGNQRRSRGAEDAIRRGHQLNRPRENPP